MDHETVASYWYGVGYSRGVLTLVLVIVLLLFLYARYTAWEWEQWQRTTRRTPRAADAYVAGGRTESGFTSAEPPPKSAPETPEKPPETV